MRQITIAILLIISGFTAKAQLIEVKSFGHYQPIGVAVEPTTNRVFVSFPHHEPYLYGLVEIVDGKSVPYPTAEWSEYKPQLPRTHFVNVQALYADDKNFLWVLDSAPAGTVNMGGSQTNATGMFKLVKIDLSNHHIKGIYTFDDLQKDKSALNDVVIDTWRNLAYLSDPGLKCMVVLDLISGKTRLVLKNDKSMLARPGFVLNIDGKNVIDTAGKAFVSNVNGIALTREQKWLYYRAINQDDLYRIRAEFVGDPRYKDWELVSKIQKVAETGVCHGMTSDYKGNIYLSNSPEHEIQYVTPEGKVHVLVKDPRIIWPDSFAIGSDGYLYFTCSQINRLPKFNNGEDKTDFPYLLFKVKLP